MARPESTHYDLTAEEKRDLIKLIEAGKPLPERYRFLLFEDKREVELVWNGKSRDVCTAILPFQTLEHIDEPRKEADADLELGLDYGGRQVKGWANKLIWGDNKLILSSLKSGALRRQIEEAGGLKLIYIDPPFDVGADFSMDIEIGGETFHKEPNLLEQIAYRDTWGRGADSFLAMIYERLILMRDLLADDGSIFVHCDWRLNAFLRCAMNEIFGTKHFKNEIVWSYRKFARRSPQFPQSHDTILFYTKSDTNTFNHQFVGLSESTLKRWKGKKRGGKDPNNRYATDEDSEGAAMPDVWQIPLTIGANPQNTGYPTQKPIELIQTIIETATNPGDLVADFFCGSGTTAAVAEGLRTRKKDQGEGSSKQEFYFAEPRRWICTDLSKFGIHPTRKRLIQVQRDLKSAGSPFCAFEVLNLGRYERQAYLNVSSRLTGKKKTEALARKEREFRELILRAYKAVALENETFFHGKMAGRLVAIGPINLPVGRLFVEEVITECRKRGASRADILAFEFEMGLFPAILDEAKRKGIDIAPKIIPPEVFDKRAVDKGQVRFSDVAYVEANPRYDQKDKLTLALELTDFSVHYSQGIADELAHGLKEGKSEVVCDRGTLYKVSKDKNGVVSREALTKHWTDWVDYRAVDFDYESRREVISVAKSMGVEGALPGVVDSASGELIEFEDRWTGAYIFENEWQSFRTRKDRTLELKSAPHTYPNPGRYTVAVKVIDIFGNDTMALIPVTAG